MLPEVGAIPPLSSFHTQKTKPCVKYLPVAGRSEVRWWALARHFLPHGIWGGCVWKGRRVPNQTLWSLPGRLKNFRNTFRLENFYFFFISSPEEILLGEDAMLRRPCSEGNPWVLVGLNPPRLYSVVIRMPLYYLPVPPDLLF